MSDPQPADVVAAAAALAPLADLDDADPGWSVCAEPTAWTAAATLAHVTDALVFYAGQVARRARGPLPVLRDGRAAPPGEALEDVTTAAHVLAGLLRDLGPERAWHPSGLADAGGWAGMAVTEVLVHGHDAAAAVGVVMPLPGEVCARTVARVFPWVPASAGAPGDLLLAVTGRALLPSVPADPQWWWQSAPLAEWDGHPRRRTSPPRWR